jgi:calpain-15
MWGPFLEKAWAKVSGNYEVVEGGWGHEAIRFITGAPTSSFYNDWNIFSADDAWNVLQTADVASHIIMAGTSGSCDAYNLANGLAANHAYTVLSVHNLTNADGTLRTRLIKMRNPWSVDGAYNGSYSDLDPVWNTAGQTYARQVNFTNDTRDGVFFITPTDYYTYFTAFSISY